MSPLTRTIVSTTALTCARGTVSPNFADGAVNPGLRGSGALAVFTGPDPVDNRPVFPLLLILQQAR